MATQKSGILLITQAIFLLNAVIWLAFGIVSLVRLTNGHSTPTITLWVVAILMFGNVAAMLIAGIWLGCASKWAFFFALMVLSVNILLTFTDQVGFFDIITVLIDFGLVGLLLCERKNWLMDKTIS